MACDGGGVAFTDGTLANARETPETREDEGRVAVGRRVQTDQAVELRARGVGEVRGLGELRRRGLAVLRVALRLRVLQQNPGPGDAAPDGLGRARAGRRREGRLRRGDVLQSVVVVAAPRPERRPRPEHEAALGLVAQQLQRLQRLLVGLLRAVVVAEADERLAEAPRGAVHVDERRRRQRTERLAERLDGGAVGPDGLAREAQFRERDADGRVLPRPVPRGEVLGEAPVELLRGLHEAQAVAAEARERVQRLRRRVRVREERPDGVPNAPRGALLQQPPHRRGLLLDLGPVAAKIVAEELVEAMRVAGSGEGVEPRYPDLALADVGHGVVAQGAAQGVARGGPRVEAELDVEVAEARGRRARVAVRQLDDLDARRRFEGLVGGDGVGRARADDRAAHDVAQPRQRARPLRVVEARLLERADLALERRDLQHTGARAAPQDDLEGRPRHLRGLVELGDAVDGRARPRRDLLPYGLVAVVDFDLVDGLDGLEGLAAVLGRPEGVDVLAEAEELAEVPEELVGARDLVALGEEPRLAHAAVRVGAGGPLRRVERHAQRPFGDVPGHRIRRVRELRRRAGAHGHSGSLAREGSLVEARARESGSAGRLRLRVGTRTARASAAREVLAR